MPELIPNQNLNAMLGQSLGSGLAQGLQTLAQNKVKEINRSKVAQNYQRAYSISPDLAESFARLEEVHPESVRHLLDNLQVGVNAGQQQQPTAEGQSAQPQFNQYVPGRKVAEDKEARKGVNKFLEGFHKKYKAVDELGNLAENTLKELEEAKKDLPSFPFNLVSQKYNPIASAKVRKLEAAYNKIVSKVAAAEAAGSGFRSGAALTKLAASSKSALDQPYETQKSLLEDIIAERDEARGIQKSISDIKKQSGGTYPVDLEDKIIEMSLGGSQPMQQQAQSGSSNDEYVGDIKKDPATGQVMKWDSSQNRYRLAKKRG